MNAEDRHKIFIARLNLHDELDRRSRSQPGFLRRNLRVVLDQHEHQLQLERGHAPTSQSAIDHEPRTSKWDLYAEEILRRMMKNRETIRIDHLRLVAFRDGSHGGSDRNATRQDVLSGAYAADRPPWLPASDVWRVWCQVFVKIAHRSDAQSIVYYELRDAQITRHELKGRPPEFEIALEEPFEIRIDKLKAEAVYDNDGGTKRTRAADNDGHSMRFGIRCQTSEDAAELLSQLEHRNVSTYQFASVIDAMLTCSWDALPNVPSPGHLMKLKRAHEERSPNMQYGVEASMFHSKNLPTSRYNRALRLRGEARQLPTPSVSDDLESSRPKMQVHYLTTINFVTRGAVMVGLKCILCQRDIEHSSPERLMLHYLTNHDHLKWTIDYEYSTDSLLLVRVEVGDAVPTQNDVEEIHGDEIEWVAPKSAFNLKAHLQGDQEWVLPAPKSSKSVHNTPRHPKSTKMLGRKDKPLAQPLLQALAMESRKRKITAPEDVVDLTPYQRKRHPVPEVEGISFYRTISKQRVAPGTEISDSEDEADTSWVLQSQRRDQTQLGVSQVARDFNELFNTHLDEETPLSDSFTRDAVVRFTRKFKARLGTGSWRDEFERKLRQLESKKIVNADTVRYCLELVTSPGEDVPQMNGAHKDQGESDADRRAIGEQLGVTSPPPASRKAKMKPLGSRKILCARPGSANSHKLFPITDLLLDGDNRERDDIRPRDVDYGQLVQILEQDLGFKRDTDHIVCTVVNTKTYHPIAHQNDLISALSDHKVLTAKASGLILFELRDKASFEKGLERSRNLSTEQARGLLETSKDGKKAGAKKKECICGVEVEAMRGAFSCGNASCSRNFHLACLIMDRRPDATWTCEDCSQ